MCTLLSILLHLCVCLSLSKPKSTSESGITFNNTIQARLRSIEVPELEPNSLNAPETTHNIDFKSNVATPLVVPRTSSTKQLRLREATTQPSESPDPLSSSSLSRNSESLYRTNGFDQPPRLLSVVNPEYPEGVGQREGALRLRVLINESGVVDDVEIVASMPKGVFDEAGIKAFREAKFSPGTIFGVPVKSSLLVEVFFTPVNRGGAVGGQSY